MNTDELFSFIKSQSILFPAVIGLWRYKKIDSLYRPFIFYLLVGLATEVSTFVLFTLYPRSTNNVVSNLYVLVEWLFILWQFERWGFIKKSNGALMACLGAVTAVWVFENLILLKIANDFSPYFRIIYSFTVVLLTVNIINYSIINDSGNLLQNGRFIVCISFIIFFIYKLIFEWAYQYMLIVKVRLTGSLIIASYDNVNAFCNILSGVAILYFPSSFVAGAKPATASATKTQVANA